VIQRTKPAGQARCCSICAQGRALGELRGHYERGSWRDPLWGGNSQFTPRDLEAAFYPWTGGIPMNTM